MVSDFNAGNDRRSRSREKLATLVQTRRETLSLFSELANQRLDAVGDAHLAPCRTGRVDGHAHRLTEVGKSQVEDIDQKPIHFCKECFDVVKRAQRP